jgi:hypothetical protein
VLRAPKGAPTDCLTQAALPTIQEVDEKSAITCVNNGRIRAHLTKVHVDAGKLYLWRDILARRTQ